MKLTKLSSQKGIAHLALILIPVLAVVVGASIFVVMKNNSNSEGTKTADAAGASYICGSGYVKRHEANKDGWQLLNFYNANASTNRKGCAIVRKNYGGPLYGRASTMRLTVKSTAAISTDNSTSCGSTTSFIFDGDHKVAVTTGCRHDIGIYKYYAGPIYYKQKAGVILTGSVQDHGTTTWTTNSN